MNSNLLCHLFLPSTSPTYDSWLTRLATRILYSQLPALPEVLSRSVQAPRTPGQDLEVRQTLVLHSATCLLLKVVGGSSHLPLFFECCLLFTGPRCHVFTRRLFCKFLFLSPPSTYRLFHVAVLHLVLELCGILLFDVRLGVHLGLVLQGLLTTFLQQSHLVVLLASWTLPTRDHVHTVMSFLHGSGFTLLAQLGVQRQDMILGVFCSTLHDPSSSLHVTSFSRKATPSTGIPQSSGRYRGARQSPSRASSKPTSRPDHLFSRNVAFQVVSVVAYADWMNHCLCLKLCKPDFSVSSAAVIASIDS